MYRDSIIEIPAATLTDTLPVEVVRWDTINQLVTISLPQTTTSKDGDGLRVSARFTPSGIEVKATRVDTVFKVQSVERTRVVTIEPERNKWAWLKWFIVGFGTGVICIICFAIALRR